MIPRPGRIWVLILDTWSSIGHSEGGVFEPSRTQLNPVGPSITQLTKKLLWKTIQMPWLEGTARSLYEQRCWILCPTPAWRRYQENHGFQISLKWDRGAMRDGKKRAMNATYHDPKPRDKHDLFIFLFQSAQTLEQSTISLEPAEEWHTPHTRAQYTQMKSMQPSSDSQVGRRAYV
jgi:hypothetical protein